MPDKIHCPVDSSNLYVGMVYSPSGSGSTGNLTVAPMAGFRVNAAPVAVLVRFTFMNPKLSIGSMVPASFPMKSPGKVFTLPVSLMLTLVICTVTLLTALPALSTMAPAGKYTLALFSALAVLVTVIVLELALLIVCVL